MTLKIDKNGNIIEGENVSDRNLVNERFTEILDFNNLSIVSKSKYFQVDSVSSLKKFTICLREISPAQRTNDREFRIQLNDREICQLVDSSNNTLIDNHLAHNELFIPLGYYHDLHNDILLFSTLDPRRINDQAITRSYYINLEAIARAQIEGIAFSYDSSGERVISFLAENLIGIISNMDLFFE